MIEIIAVGTNKEKKIFVDFPHKLYAEDPNYVPALYLDQFELISPTKHPFYQHSEAQPFLAIENGKVVGRILAIWNNNHNAALEKKEGHIGFFDCIDNQDVANSLFDAAVTWLKKKGATTMTGPINLTTNDTCGLLIDGFDLPAVALMPYNYPYYQDLFTKYGFSKKVELRAYMVDNETVDFRSVNLLDKLEERLKRSGIILRQINLKDFKKDADRIKEIYNKAWEKNQNFVPMTDSEFDHTAKTLKAIVDPQYCILAEKDNEIVGFALGIPDINQILIRIKRGRLLPTGIFKLLFGRKKINLIRVLMLGVLEPYRKLGIEACLYGRIIKNGKKAGLRGAECSWTLEDNYLMNKAIENVNGRLYKRYLLLEKKL